MLSLLKRTYERWCNWTGDRDLEFAIRQHLSNNGHFGGLAKLQNVKLAAVQRPGWLQVYRFEAVARKMPADASDEADTSEDVVEQPAVYETLYGLVREDFRKHQTLVRTFYSESERRELFQLWSHDLIQLRGGREFNS